MFLILAHGRRFSTRTLPSDRNGYQKVGFRSLQKLQNNVESRSCLGGKCQRFAGFPVIFHSGKHKKRIGNHVPLTFEDCRDFSD